MFTSLIVSLLWVLSFLLCGTGEGKSPSILYLTWISDPTTTMTVQWQTGSPDLEEGVLYRDGSQGTWKKKGGLHTLAQGTKVWVHMVELDGLVPDREYQFRLSGDQEVYWFRTMPKELSREVRFVVGGDAYMYLDRFREMNEQIAEADPDFVVVGGDIAYANGSRFSWGGRKGEVKRWQTFLKEWKSRGISSEGRMIPLLPVLGNHDIRGSSLSRRRQYPLFYEFFALPEKGISYRVIDFGGYLSLFLLDSGHCFHVSGQQEHWLEKRLKERTGVGYQFAAYHIAAYPSVYPYEGTTPQQIRKFWSPLFEKYHVNMAFEHHNHAYKRTFPITGEKVDPEGVVYVGDGSWGVSTRRPKSAWYLARQAKENAVCVITLTPEKGVVSAMNKRGEVFDEVETFPRVFQEM